jgi:hypothetical protein
VPFAPQRFDLLARESGKITDGLSAGSVRDHAQGELMSSQFTSNPIFHGAFIL